MKRTLLPYLLCAALAALSGCSKEKVCAADQNLCSDNCTSLQIDARNCGACGHACATGQACKAGACSDCVAAGTCNLDVYAACFHTNELRGVTAALEASGAPLATDTGPGSTAFLNGKLYVANVLSNTLSEVTFTPAPSVRNQAAKVFGTSGQFGPDLEFLAAHGNLLYVSNTSVNTLVVVDPARGTTNPQQAIVDEIPLADPAVQGEYVNVQGMDFVEGKAYVALNAVDAVAVVDVSGEAACTPPSASAPACDAARTCAAGTQCLNGLCQRSPCGRVLKRIPLPAHAGPERVRAFTTGIGATGKVYVTLSNLDPATFQPFAGEHGKLAVIDPSTDTVSQVIDLGPGCLDPADVQVLSGALYVTCGFQDFMKTQPPAGAGIVQLSLTGAQPQPLAPIAVQGLPGALAFCGGHGYAGDRSSGNLFRVDPAARTVTTSAPPICPASNGFAYVSAVACAP